MCKLLLLDVWGIVNEIDFLVVYERNTSMYDCLFLAVGSFHSV